MKMNVAQAKQFKNSKTELTISVGYIAPDGTPAVWKMENVSITGVWKVSGSGYVLEFNNGRSCNMHQVVEFIEIN